MKLERAQLPIPEAEFRAKYAAYVAEREEHKATVGVPAPFPELEIFRVLYETGQEIELVEPAEDTGEPKDSALAQKRQAAIDALLAESAKREDAPQAVKDYAEAVK